MPRKLMVFLVPMVLSVFISGSARALTLQQKTEAFALDGCYVNGAFISSPATIALGDFEIYTDLLTGSYTSSNLRLAQNLGSGYQSVKTDCSTLLRVYVLPDRNLPTTKLGMDEAGESARREILEKMGYEAVETSDICYHFPVSVRVSDSYAGNIDYDFVSRSLCAASDDTIPNSTNIYSTDTSDEDTSTLVPGYTNPVKISINRKGIEVKKVSNSITGNTETFKYSDYTTFGSMITAIKNYVMNAYTPPVEKESGNDDTGYTTRTYSYDISASIGPIPAGSTYAVEYMTGKTANDALRALNRLYGIENINELELTSEEKKELYISYLDSVYNLDIKSADEVEESDAISTGYERVAGSGSLSCWVKSLINDSVNISTTPVGVDGGYLNKDGTWQELVKELGADIVCDLDINGGATADPSSGNGEEDTECYKWGGPIGWILCPIVRGISSVGNSMWEKIEEKYMQIPAGEVFKDGSSVANGWGVVRDIANVLFIVLFLFVIFSQLTGVGIDNYGIKKIMPKLITTAVLVNLSFLICGLAVDLSNILGQGLNNLLANADVTSATIDMGDTTLGGTEATVGGILGVVLGGGGLVLYTMLGGLGVIGTLIAVFGVILSIFVSILTLFLILVIREAGIVIAIVIAPVAIVCYMLPNTEKFYKRWFDLFKALLVVYPICGALVGGGKLASAVLGGIEGMGLAAMIVQVLPFFLIPMLLKNSLALLGNVGAKVSNLGKGLSGRADKALRGTDAMKASMQEASDRRIMRKAGINAKTGELTARGERRAKRAGGFLGKLSGYDRMQSARIRAAQDVRGKDIAAGAALVGAIATSEMVDKGQTPAKYYEEQMDAAAKDGDITAYETAVEAAIASGQLKDKDIAAMVRRTVGQTQTSVTDEGVRQNFYRKMAAKHGNGFMATDVEMRSWMQQSGKLKQQNGQMVDYNISSSVAGDYASRGGMSVDDIKLGDVQKMSGDSMAAMITSGIISRGMAEEALAAGGLSDDKKIMLGAAANGAVPTGMSPDDLKGHAKVLANGLGSDPTDLNRINAYNSARNALGVSDDQVAMWTAPRAEDVTIRDVSIRNAQDGSKNQTDVLQVHQRGVKVTPRPVPPRSSPPTPPPTP